MTKDIVSTSNNILEAIGCDFLGYFESEYWIINTEDSPAVQIVNYEKKCNSPVLNVFDTISLMVMFDKFFIESDTHMNITFKSVSKPVDIDDIARITNLFHKILGPDDSKHRKWNKSDLLKLNNGTFNRIWPTGLGDSFLKLSINEKTGFEISILFLNNLLENIGKKIIFN